MEHFSTDDAKGVREDDALDMSVSAICRVNGEKKAYVSFSDGRRSAEGLIPDCKITKNNGFTDDETAALEAYMKQELPSLKKMASGVNVMSAFLGETR